MFIALRRIKSIVSRLSDGSLEPSDSVFDELKELIRDLPKRDVLELAYLVSLHSVKSGKGDFWFFADILRGSVWFCKLMGISALYALRRGMDYMVYVEEGEKNAEMLDIGFRSLGYIMLADSTSQLDLKLGFKHLKRSFLNMREVNSSVIGGTIFIMSKICIAKGYECKEMIEKSIDEVYNRDDLTNFEKADILDYIAEIVSCKYIDLSRKALELAVGLVKYINDPELKALAISLTSQSIYKVSEVDPHVIDKIGLDPYEGEESRKILDEYVKLKKEINIK